MVRSKKSQSSMLLVGCIGLLLLSYIGGTAIKAYRNSQVKPLQIPTQNTPQDKTPVSNVLADNSRGSYEEIQNPNMMPMDNTNNDFAFNSNFGANGGFGGPGGGNMDFTNGGGRGGRGGRGGGMGGGGMGGGRGGRGGGMGGGMMGGGGMGGGGMMGGGDTVGGNFNVVGGNTGNNFNVIGDNGGADAAGNTFDQPAADQSFDDMGGGFN